jgi:DNA-binding transcriptional MocR family regulator
MSWQHARAVLDTDGVKPAAKFVLVAIALRAGTDGRAWPSIARISADTGYSRSTVKAAIAALRRTGHLAVIHSPGRPLLMTVTGSAPGPPTGSAPGPTGSDDAQKRVSSRPQKRKEENKKGATTGSTTTWPAVADNGNGTPVVPKPGAHPQDCICGGTGEIHLDYGTFECGGGVL